MKYDMVNFNVLLKVAAKDGYEYLPFEEVIGIDENIKIKTSELTNVNDVDGEELFRSCFVELEGD